MKKHKPLKMVNAYYAIMKNSDSLQYPNVFLREIKERLIYCFLS